MSPVCFCPRCHVCDSGFGALLRLDGRPDQAMLLGMRERWCEVQSILTLLRCTLAMVRIFQGDTPSLIYSLALALKKPGSLNFAVSLSVP